MTIAIDTIKATLCPKRYDISTNIKISNPIPTIMSSVISIDFQNRFIGHSFLNTTILSVGINIESLISQ